MRLNRLQSNCKTIAEQSQKNEKAISHRKTTAERVEWIEQWKEIHSKTTLHTVNYQNTQSKAYLLKNSTAALSQRNPDAVQRARLDWVTQKCGPCDVAPILFWFRAADATVFVFMVLFDGGVGEN
jgi:hypothetical protein